MNHGPKFRVSEHFSQCFKVFNPSKTKVYHSTVVVFWGNSLIFDTNEKKAKLLDPERVQTLWSNIARKTWMSVAFFVFCVSNITSLRGENKKLWKNKLLVCPKYGLHFSLRYGPVLGLTQYLKNGSSNAYFLMNERY